MSHAFRDGLGGAAALGGVLLLASTATGQSGTELFLVDFEGFAEETEVDDEYAALGVTFSTIGDPAAPPIIAVEGAPPIGFASPSGDDTPMPDGIAGLTDALVDGDFTIGRNFAIEFDPPVTSVRFFVVDIDGTESYTARAFAGAVEVDSVTRTAGQTGTGDGVSTEFFLASDGITSVTLEVPAITGFAIDFLSFTRPCEGSACGSIVEVAQESAPGAGDFDANVLGTLLSYPTTATAAGFYAYGVPEGSSWNGQSLIPVADRSHLLLADTADGLSLAIVHDRAIPDDPDGGMAEMRVEVFGDADGLIRTVEDDPVPTEPPGSYVGDPGDTLFTAVQAWGACCTDGYVLSDLESEWSMLVSFTEVDGNGGTPPIMGMIEWVAYSGDGSEIPLALAVDRRVRLRRLAFSCPEDCAEPPDGVVDVSDLLALLAQWGQSGGACDINQDGAVDVVDLLALLAAWGPCD